MPRSSSDTKQAMVVMEINDLVDQDLMKDMGDWLNERPQMKATVVAATLAAMLGDAIADMCQNQQEVCVYSGAFGDYVHQFSHWSFDEHKDSNKTSH